MFGLSGIKLIAIGLAVVAILAVVAGGYAFINHQIDARVNAAVDAAQNRIAAEINAKTAKAIQDQAEANNAAVAATNQRLDVLDQQLNANQVQTNQLIGRLASHDLGKDAAAHPQMVQAIVDRGADRTLCLLEKASGAGRNCDGAK